MTVSHDLEGMWKEEAVALFQVVCLSLSRSAKENCHSFSACAVPWPALEPDTSQIQFRGITTWANLPSVSLRNTKGKYYELFISYKNINLAEYSANPILLLVNLPTLFCSVSELESIQREQTQTSMHSWTCRCWGWLVSFRLSSHYLHLNIVC